ncbi:P-loop containing nucleoside triphosphate hydrolase protein [Scheffersomyces xylosifermentans]|uniref:P-loop containing nucleoside triphosphate hydrolase protein n=1 Tax=Scheffersomyces xylosifermentans TaxID=1304137 RepID=UPI00315C6EF3
MKGKAPNLDNLEEQLSSRVVDQPAAIKAVAAALRSCFADSTPHLRSLLLFLGSPGSGKTELARQIANYLYSDERALIRLNCSMLNNDVSVARLIGTSAPGEDGILGRALKTKPHSIILLDEAELASPEVLDIFLNIVKEGQVTAGNGKVFKCSNNIVILKSAIGSDYIASSGSVQAVDKIVNDEVFKCFGKDFADLVHCTALFQSLSEESISKIVKLNLNQVQRRFSMYGFGKSLGIDLDESALHYLYQRGCSKKLGAKSLNNIIENELLGQLAIMLLSGQVKDEETVSVTIGKRGLELLPNHEVVDIAVGNDDDWDDSDQYEEYF